jgi:hypothetical protein
MHGFLIFELTNFDLNLALAIYSEGGEMWGIHGVTKVSEELDASAFKIYVVQKPSFRNVANHSSIYKLPGKL